MPDLNGVLLGGFSVVVLVLFLVQAFREAFPAVDSRFLPLISLFVAVGLVSLSNFAPEAVVKTVATGIAVGAAASLSVRYVKNGDSGPSAEPATTQSGITQGSQERPADIPYRTLPAVPANNPAEAPNLSPIHGFSNTLNIPSVSYPIVYDDLTARGIAEANPRGEEPLHDANAQATVTMPPTK
jgi:hypothetical protein